MIIIIMYSITLVVLIILIAQVWRLTKMLQETRELLHHKTTAAITHDEKKHLIESVEHQISATVDKTFESFAQTVLLSAKESSSKLHTYSEETIASINTAYEESVHKELETVKDDLKRYKAAQVETIDSKATDLVKTIAKEKFALELNPTTHQALTKKAIEMYLES